MNYNGGNTSDGWEALLLNSMGFTTTLTDGTDNTSGDHQHQAASGYSNSSTLVQIVMPQLAAAARGEFMTL